MHILTSATKCISLCTHVCQTALGRILPGGPETWSACIYNTCSILYGWCMYTIYYVYYIQYIVYNILCHTIYTLGIIYRINYPGLYIGGSIRTKSFTTLGNSSRILNRPIPCSASTWNLRLSMWILLLWIPYVSISRSNTTNLCHRMKRLRLFGKRNDNVFSIQNPPCLLQCL